MSFDTLPINLLDLVVLIVLLLSGIVAFVRGMTREFMKLAAWIGAAFAAIHGFAFVRPYARSVIPVEFLADSVAGVGLFIISLVLLSVVGNFIADQFKDSGHGPLDRSLGFVFGMARGAVIVSLAYLFVAWIVKGESLPDWVVAAKSRPFLERGAALIVEFAPPQLRNEAVAAAEATRLRARQAIETDKKVRELSKPATKEGDGAARPGYKKGERKEMDRLIQSTQ